MGIMDFFRNKQNGKVAVKTDTETNKVKVQAEDEEPFVVDLSLVELDNADWAEFAGILKKNRILPNSYVKTPVEKQLGLDENGRPKIRLKFESATSSSVRELVLFQDNVTQYVNGNVSDKQHTELLDAWSDFQSDIRYWTMLETNRSGYFQAMDGDNMLKIAMKKKGMRDIYQREQEFLKKYRDASFCEMTYGYLNDPPAFIRTSEDGRYRTDELVVPFSPRTLELCIINMTNECQEEQGMYRKDFEGKCRKIAEISCFESPNWDQVIAFGKDLVRAKYLASELGKEIER